MNSNCLADLQCPNCKSYEPLSITGVSVFKVFDSGTESHGDVEWDDDSFVKCGMCGFSAVLECFGIIPKSEAGGDRHYHVVVYGKKRYERIILATNSKDAVVQARAVLAEKGLDEREWQEDYEFHELDVVEDPQEVKDDN